MTRDVKKFEKKKRDLYINWEGLAIFLYAQLMYA
jgi:hypothetical protein